MESIGLYIHIPFCSRKCDYCDFVSYSMNRKAQQLYLEALFAEIDMLKDKYVDAKFVLSTFVYTICFTETATDEEFYEKCSSGSLESVKTTFSLSKVLGDTYNIYKEIL